MTPSTRLAVLAGLLFSVGWILVLVPGDGGDSTGAAEMVWRVGGIMVYASVPLALAVAVGSLVAGCFHRRRLSGERPSH